VQYPKLSRRAGLFLVPALLTLGACAVLAPRAQAGSEGLTAYAYQPRLGAPGAYIRLGWSRPRAVPSSYILGYVIWRTDISSPLQVVGGLDTDAQHAFTDSEASRNVTAYDGIPGSADAGSRTVFQSVQGIVPGRLYNYQVAAAYVNGLQDRDNDGVPDDGEFMSPLSMRTNWVTAIAPPRIATVNGQTPGGSTLVDLKSFDIQWEQTPGADTYEVWVGRNPAFTGTKLRIKAVKTLPVDLGGEQTVTLNINANRGGFRNAQVLYVAVGARNSKDRIKPRPYGAIFSAPVAVKPETPPPDNP
jgi:hypothetical protein